MSMPAVQVFSGSYLIIYFGLSVRHYTRDGSTFSKGFELQLCPTEMPY